MDLDPVRTFLLVHLFPGTHAYHQSLNRVTLFKPKPLEHFLYVLLFPYHQRTILYTTVNPHAEKHFQYPGIFHFESNPPAPLILL